MGELSTELLMDIIDSAIDELAKSQEKLKRLKTITFEACQLVDSLTQQVANLESENESLRCSESFHETRDHNRARRVGQQLQEGSNGKEV